MEARRVPAQLAGRLALFLLTACSRRGEVPSIPEDVDRWARDVLARSVDEVCDAPPNGFFCRVRESLVPAEVRALGMHTIWLQAVTHPAAEHYIDMDWGGGHVDAYGVIIGPLGWTHAADVERGEKRLRDGVFTYDTRQ